MKELQDTIASGSADRRSVTLLRLVDLLLTEGERLSEAKVGLFDAVLLGFVRTCETDALVEVSSRLAPAACAPHATVKQLASHPDINVAAPVLTGSPKLSTDDLIEAAAAHGQDHLVAIAKRDSLDEALSDVLIELGGRDVRLSVAGNPGAKLSATALKRLVAAAKDDSLLTEKTGLRADLPSDLLEKLLRHASQAARARVLAKTPPHRRAEVQRSVEEIEKKIAQEAVRPRDFRSAAELVKELKSGGRLTENKLAEFAKDRQYETIIVALAALASAPIELVRPLMRSHRSDGLLVACRAAELAWETTRLVILSRLSTSSEDCDRLRRRFDELSVSIAKRTLNIWKEQALKPRRTA